MTAPAGSHAILVPVTATQAERLREIAADDGVSVQEMLEDMVKALVDLEFPDDD